MPTLRYRLALDLGSTSLGWAMIRLNAQSNPCAVIKAGVRIFSDGRNPKDGSSLAVTRREARSMRRRRDRLLKRKARMTKTLTDYGFFPADETQRKALVTLNPYELRAKGLDAALTPAEFARALFHINQRRGFKSNRKTDKKDNDSGALKQAILGLRAQLDSHGHDGKARTVGELLNRRLTNTAVPAQQRTVRARYHEQRILNDDGKSKIHKSYDLYIDRAMIEAEFDALWAKQSELNPALFNGKACDDLRYCLLFQRSLKSVKPGRCTLMPEEERAPLALPSVQRFRIYQEVNNLRILREELKEEALTLQQRDDLAAALEVNAKRTFTQIKKLLGFGGTVQFNFENPKRQELKGNTTSAILAKDNHFGGAWFAFDEAKQDAIVLQLVGEENEATLVRWLQEEAGVDEAHAETIANAGLPEGYGSLCSKALARILPELRRDVVTYDKAVLAAGFEHHSRLNDFAEMPGRTIDTGIERINPSTGEIQKLHAFHALPYYGEFLQRHVGFGSGKPDDSDEKRYGKIANPTVHIGLNQVRVVVNALVKRYGHPSEVIVELARDLKQSKDHSQSSGEPYREKPGCSCQRCVTAQQANNQRRNVRLRADIASALNISPERVHGADIQKMILWEELSNNVAERRCPYSGAQISAAMLLSDQVEIEHILPFSETLDDSLNNKTVSMRQANRIKGNRTPWQAREDFAAQGWDYEGIIERAKQIPNKAKRDRFAEDGLQRWLREDKSFLARALNDTRHLSKVAREYLSLVCPQDTRVIPGRMTAMLRAKFGLNDVLGLNGEKNRNDHRHHAVDACVIAVTDQGLLQRFAKASASAREQQLNRLVEDMPLPWPTYREHVQRAISSIWVSHKPDHGYEGTMHEDTTYRPPHLDRDNKWRTRGIGGNKPHEKEADSKAMIGFTGQGDEQRYQRNDTGELLPYKGYVASPKFCIDIARNVKGKWEGEVVSTFNAYRLISALGKEAALSQMASKSLSISGKPLVMRLQGGDLIRIEEDGKTWLMRLVKMTGNGQVFFAPHNEANVDARNSDKQETFAYVSKTAGTLQKVRARRVTISPIGELNDPGYKE